MILKSLTLQNFRSYGETPTRIDFDRGTLLFEGDIGSGKSSILYGIEFALFGLGESEAKNILRVSTTHGKVELEFEVSGKEYKVSRTIERKKTSQIQTKGWINEGGGKETEFAPTELKTRILQILNFKENPGRASSRIYRFAVFTPQELMKEVLSQKPDERVDTLRRAFGIEDYSFAGVNTEIVISRLENQAKILFAVSRDLGERESQLSQRKNNLIVVENELRKAQLDLAEIVKKIDLTRLTLERLETERTRTMTVQASIQEISKSLTEWSTQLSEARTLLDRSAKELRDIEQAEVSLASLRKQYDENLNRKERLRTLESLSEEKFSLDQEIQRINQNISSKEKNLIGELASLELDSSILKKNLEMFEKELLVLPELQESSLKLQEETKELSKLQEELEQLKQGIGEATATGQGKRSEIEKIRFQFQSVNKLSGESECPLCKQKLDVHHLRIVTKEFKGKIASLESEAQETEETLSVLKLRIKTLESQREVLTQSRMKLESIEKRMAEIQAKVPIQKETSDDLNEVERRTSRIKLLLETSDYAIEDEAELTPFKKKREALEGSLKEYADLKELVKRFEDSGIQRAFLTAENTANRKNRFQQLISEQEKRISELEKFFSEKNRKLVEKRKELEESEPRLLEYSRVKEEIEKLQYDLSETKSTVARLETEIKSESGQTSTLNKEVEKLKKSSARASIYRGFSSWLEDHFLPAIQDIEKNVLGSINEEFNQVFQKWFSTLVDEGELSISVDDVFTPIVDQSGYELDIQSLSGGERTAVALAYRLALNHMVKRANETMQTNLLILDEPTEGFSKEQVYRMRHVLQELNCDQVVIVSHERDLEGMADRVYRVEKMDGESTVSPIVG